MELYQYVGIILTMIACWYFLSERVANIAADIKVIRETVKQQTHSLATILEGAMEKCRYFSNGKCTYSKNSTICYCGCPLHQKAECETTIVQQPQVKTAEVSGS